MVFSRKLKIAMIGGGRNAFIGSIHRIAFQMDGLATLVAGALSSQPENAMLSGQDLFLPADRIYTSYESMIKTEALKSDAERPDIICIVTPNHLHFEPAKMALEHGFHVAIDKPITFNLQEALTLKDILLKTNKKLLLTHTYTGYPMVKQARHMVNSGTLGNIRKVIVEYPQGWLSDAIENTGNTQAAWRTDPQKSGIAGAMGDIGTHAFNLAEYVTQLKVTHLCAQINTVVKDRKLDDDGTVLLRFENGATGVLIATQIACGEENNVRIRVYGEKGGLDWQQEINNTLKVMWPDQPAQLYRTAAGYNDISSNENTRTPPGHPEGYLEAFANHYRNFFAAILAHENPALSISKTCDYPDIDHGIRGMRFIEKVIFSGQSVEKWIPFD